MLTTWLGRQKLGKSGQEPKHLVVPGQQVRQLEEGYAVSACLVRLKPGEKGITEPDCRVDMAFRKFLLTFQTIF